MPQLPLSFALLFLMMWLGLGMNRPMPLLLFVTLPSLLLDSLRNRVLLNEPDSKVMPVPSDSLASFASNTLPVELFKAMPFLFVRTSLPRTTLSRANSIEIPLSVARRTMLSIRWLRSDSITWRPPLSSIRLPSTRLSFDWTPTGGVWVTSRRTPPLLASISLSTTALKVEPSSDTPAPLEALISFPLTVLRCERSIQTASSDVAVNELFSTSVPWVLAVIQTPRLFPTTVL